MSRVLVISPHPDDEAIGCGGTIRRHVVQGDSVRTIFLTSGEKGGHGRSPEETAVIREKEAKAAAKILGLEHIEFWRQPDGALSATRQLVERLSIAIEKLRPETLYVTHGKEAHSDHRSAARIVRRALTSFEDPFLPMVRMFEVWTPLQRMDDIVDISPFLEVKMAAIKAYRSQCDILRFDEAFLGLSRYRGELHNWSEGDYAEIFLRMQI